MEKFLNHMPGFRTDKKWKMIVSIIYYLFCIRMLLAVGIGSFLIVTSIPFIIFATVKVIKNRNKTVILILIGSIFIFTVGIKVDSIQSKSNPNSSIQKLIASENDISKSTVIKKKADKFSESDKAMLKKSYKDFSVDQRTQFITIEEKYAIKSDYETKAIKTDFDRVSKERDVQVAKLQAEAKAKQDNGL